MDIEKLLKNVEKPGRYLGGEWNEIKKNLDLVKAKVALVFPDVYEIGMSYLGQRILYDILNKHPDVLAERVFVPWVDFEKELRAEKFSLYSLENKIPLSKFDILGFSLLYELNYSNILTVLDLARIPLLSSQRKIHHPLVIAGGAAVFNPEPVADYFDLFLIGDGEEAFLEIIEKYISCRNQVKEKEDLLKEFTSIKGVYIPTFYSLGCEKKTFLVHVEPKKNAPKNIQKRVFFPFHEAPFPEKIVVPNIKVIFDRAVVEVARGCPQKCRFCQATSIYFPQRVKDPNFILEKAYKIIASTGYEDLSLLALSVSDYPYLDSIIGSLMEALEKKKIALSLPSLRPKGLTAQVAENIIKVRKTGFTIVPEAGTERLRRVINKDLKDSEIWEAAKNAFLRGWRTLKLYFMVGLPNEKEEDLKGIVNIVREIIRIGYSTLKRAPLINLSMSSFIPKPHTPFQWVGMEDENILKEKHKYIKSRLRKYPFVRFKENNLKNSILEAVFSRGDRKLGLVLLNSWKNGARFDSWSDCFDFRIWEKSFQQMEIDYHQYLMPINPDVRLPWDHIDTGYKKSHLIQELKKALNEESTPSCLERECSECKGCSLSHFYEKKFNRSIDVLPEIKPYFGKKSTQIFRYRAIYTKVGNSKYLSHIDVSNIIQRSFRRAGISVAYSKGFHPKMLISFLPALPLGMEGHAEVMDFKSDYIFSDKEFIRHINKFCPPGIKFQRLICLDEQDPSLNRDIQMIIYSVDLNSQEVKIAIDNYRKSSGLVYDESVLIASLVSDYIKHVKEDRTVEIKVDQKKRKLMLRVLWSHQNPIRPQEIVSRIFGIKNPVYIMARERTILHHDLLKLTTKKDLSIKLETSQK